MGSQTYSSCSALGCPNCVGEPHSGTPPSSVQCDASALSTLITCAQDLTTQGCVPENESDEFVSCECNALALGCLAAVDVTACPAVAQAVANGTSICLSHQCSPTQCGLADPTDPNAPSSPNSPVVNTPSSPNSPGVNTPNSPNAPSTPNEPDNGDDDECS